jgi:hypothetical protein
MRDEADISVQENTWVTCWTTLAGCIRECKQPGAPQPMLEIHSRLSDIILIAISDQHNFALAALGVHGRSSARMRWLSTL